MGHYFFNKDGRPEWSDEDSLPGIVQSMSTINGQRIMVDESPERSELLKSMKEHWYSDANAANREAWAEEQKKADARDQQARVSMLTKFPKKIPTTGEGVTYVPWWDSNNQSAGVLTRESEKIKPTPITDPETGQLAGYTINSITPGYSAEYDLQGNLIYAKGPEATYGGNKYIPRYDASSGKAAFNPVPKPQASHGFLGDLMSALGPIGPIIIAIAAPELLPMLGSFAAPAMTAAVGVLSGQDPIDALEGAGLSYLGSQIGAGVSSGLTDSIGSTAANIVGNVAKSEITSGGKIDPVQALISGGIGAGTSAVLGEIPGFDTFDPKTQAAISKVVGSTLATGNLSPSALINAAITAGTSAAANATNTPTESQFTDDNQAFVDSLAPYLSTDTPTSNAADANTADNQDFIDLLAPHQSTDITDLIATDFPADTKGNWDEVTGKFVPDENGGTTYGQINPATSGNVENMKDWVFDKESGKWAWTDPETGETTNYDYATPITGGPVQTGKDIEDKAGAGVDGNATPVAPVKIPAAKVPAAKVPAAKAPAATTPAPTDTTKKPAVNTTDLAALLATLSGGQQAPQYMPGVGDVAHIKSSNLFGPLLGSEEPAPSATKSQSDSVDQLLAEDEQYASGGHVDNLSVDALLHILRS